MPVVDKIKELANFLNDAYNSKSIISCLSTFLKRNFEVENFGIYIFDENTLSLRNFLNNLIIVDNKKSELYTIWELLNSGKTFVSKNENLYYPLKKYNKIIGFMEFDDLQNNEVLEFLDITSFFISLKIQNIILTEKMRKNIEFHSSMKNIAKIIETQYETNYIIPIIGEMIDKFVSEHLVYIFLNNEEKNTMELIWPNSCNDNKIPELIKLVKANDEYFTTENKKIVIFPMSADNKLIGAIVTKSMDIQLHEKEMEYIEQLANQAATTINRANVYAEILRHATLDALTGFYNKRQLEERVKQEVSAAKRHKRALCAIMCDIDYFKSVNDNFGHAVGDFVLKNVSRIMKKQLRDYDIAGRFGGEEFVILLPFTKIKEAK